MIEYKTPSSDVFRSRQQFHSMQKIDSENISTWFHRLQNIIKLCDFEQLSDFMFIDKFISGLSEFDFKRVSPFATWTVDKLILIANDDLHSTENIDVKSSLDSSEIFSVYIKSESVDIEDGHVTDSNDYHQIDVLRIKKDDPVPEVPEVNNFTSDKGKTKKKKCMSSSERSRKFIEKLKQSGQYEDYKRKLYEIAKKKRLDREKEESTSSKEKRLRNIRERERERYRNIRKLKNTTKKPRDLECYLCGTKFEKTNDLKVHLTVEHQQAKRPVHQCSHCPKTTSSQEILARHVKKFHNESANTNASQKLHKCPCCDNEFKLVAQLNDHLALHPDYKPFICETCASTFKTLKNLKSHLRKHYKKKPFKCSYCNLEFIWNTSFRDHLMIHRGETPYPCKICNKKFRQMSGLKRHLISIHNPESKPFVCSTCSKSYVSLNQLKVHERNHAPGGKPYHCDLCGSGFTQNSSLKNHLKNVHAAKAEAKPST